jgi:TusA-related sulfurtransferase
LKWLRGELIMALEVLDTLGQKCPQPVLKIAVKAPDMKPGDILEILGDCPKREEDPDTVLAGIPSQGLET